MTGSQTEANPCSVIKTEMRCTLCNGVVYNLSYNRVFVGGVCGCTGRTKRVSP
jgi:hypothetical protein